MVESIQSSQSTRSLHSTRTPQTMAEKFFSRKAGRTVRAGETVTVAPDALMSNDASGPLTIEYLQRMGVDTVTYPERIAFILDHYVPCPDAKVALLQQSIFDFAARHGIRVTPAGEGIAHQVFDELGYLHPGALVIGGDSHTTTYGYLNCFAAGMGASDMAMAMHSGHLWFKVPETIRVNIYGELASGISGKDVSLHLLRLLSGCEAPYQSNYRAVEFGGSGLAAMTMDDRRVICNMLAESNAKAAIMPCDEVARCYCAERGIDTGTAIEADVGCNYLHILDVDLADIGYLLAAPHNPANVVPLAELAGLPVQMALLGTCTNGRLSDFVAAYELLLQHEGSFQAETLIIPGSRSIYLELIERGIAAEFIRRGAMLLPPACGPCCGSSPGVPRDDFTVLSTANRNFLGRMGNTSASIYLASPRVVTAAALKGYIVDPATFSNYKEEMRDAAL